MIRKYTENTSLKYKYFNKHVFEPRSVVKKKMFNDLLAMSFSIVAP